MVTSNIPVSIDDSRGFLLNWVFTLFGSAKDKQQLTHLPDERTDHRKTASKPDRFVSTD